MKSHIKILLCIFLLATGCRKKEKESGYIEKILNEQFEESFEEKEKIEQTIKLKSEWTEKISIKLNSNIESLKYLKMLLKQFNLNLTIVVDKSCCIEYEANDKPIIEVLGDILDLLGLKMLINDNNAVISEDSVYIHNYSIKNLDSIQEKKIRTVIENNFGKNSGNVMQNEYNLSIDSYSELQKNISLLVSGEEENCKFSINKQSGIVSVIATQKIHKRISKYLIAINKFLNDEILVEANIIEVVLRDRFGLGIDWGIVENVYKKMFQMNNFNIKNIFKEIQDASLFKEGVKESSLRSADLSISPVKFFEKDVNFGRTFLNILSYYGKTSSRSNPKMIISNNGYATFKAIEDYIYFDFLLEKAEREMVHNGKTIEDGFLRRADMKSAIVGVIFTVHVVKLEDGRIKLYVKPTITDANGKIDHYGYMYVMQDKLSKNDFLKIPTIPRLRTRELETTFTINNNQTVVIGGLITEKEEKESNPSANFFSIFGVKNKKTYKKTELVIVMKAKALNHDFIFDKYDIYFED